MLSNNGVLLFNQIDNNKLMNFSDSLIIIIDRFASLLVYLMFHPIITLLWPLLYAF